MDLDPADGHNTRRTLETGRANGAVCRAGSEMNELVDGAVRLTDGAVFQTVLWCAVGAVLVGVAAYVLRKIRSRAAQNEPTASELMSKFRELHSQGKISDAEFRTIKTTLAARLQQELKDNGETG